MAGLGVSYMRYVNERSLVKRKMLSGEAENTELQKNVCDLRFREHRVMQRKEKHTQEKYVNIYIEMCKPPDRSFSHSKEEMNKKSSRLL